jgi:hypothetical protein
MIDLHTAQRLVDFLNDALQTDPSAISLLVNNRVPCNQAMLEHPTIQCGTITVGLLGLLNGFVGVYDEGKRKGWGAIAAITEEDGRIVRFEILENDRSYPTDP